MSGKYKYECSDCDMKFASEDKMRIHQSKHDLDLLSTTFDPKQQAFLTFANGQTPTPTSLLKNCDELGLELDQKVDIFALSFKNANTFPSPLSNDLNANDCAIENLNTPTPQFFSSRNVLHNHTMPSKAFHIPASPLVQMDVLKTIETRSNDPRKSVIYQSMAPPVVSSKASPLKKRVLDNLRSHMDDSLPEHSASKSTTMTTLHPPPPSISVSPPSGKEKHKFTSPALIAATSTSTTTAPAKTGPVQAKPHHEAPSSSSTSKCLTTLLPRAKQHPPTCHLPPRTPPSPPPPHLSPQTSSPSPSPPPPATHPSRSSPTDQSLTSSAANITSTISDNKIMVQVMIDIGNGQKIPMNIPAANLGISLPSLIAASSSSPSSSAASTISVAPSIAPVFVTASPPAKPPQPPPPIPQIVVTDHRDETPAPSVDAKQKLKAALRKQFNNNNNNNNNHNNNNHENTARYLKRIEIEDDDYNDLDDELSLMKHPKLMDEDEGDDTNRRSKFLERNRAAAARCRKKKKEWINCLEKKSGDAVQINKKLMTETIMLRNEVAKLKMLLLEHKNCPVTKAQLHKRGGSGGGPLHHHHDPVELMSPSSYFEGSDTTDGSDIITI